MAVRANFAKCFVFEIAGIKMAEWAGVADPPRNPLIRLEVFVISRT